MAVTRERFEQGLTYGAYVAQMTRDRERFEANERAASVGVEDRAALAGKKLNVLVLTEDWCGDAIANLPVLGRLAKETGALDIRVFLRDQNDDLMAQYLNDGSRSIPVFAFFDRDFRELGRFVERPKSVTERRATERAKVFASDPAFGSPDQPVDRLSADVRVRLSDALARMRESMQTWSSGEVLREIRAITART
jgi:hypothetical protein